MSYFVVTNVPLGITRGVSWSVVAEFSDLEEAWKEADRLNDEAYAGRDWSGRAYYVTDEPDCAIDPPACREE